MFFLQLVLLLLVWPLHVFRYEGLGSERTPLSVHTVAGAVPSYNLRQQRHMVSSCHTDGQVTRTSCNGAMQLRFSQIVEGARRYAQARTGSLGEVDNSLRELSVSMMYCRRNRVFGQLDPQVLLRPHYYNTVDGHCEQQCQQQHFVVRSVSSLFVQFLSFSLSLQSRR